MNLPEIPESPLEGINSLSQGQGGDRAAFEQKEVKTEVGLLNWAYNNIWKPGYNAGATTTLNEANQVVRLATFGYVDLRKESETYKHYASVYRDIPKAEVGTAEWFVQTASGGVGGMVPYLIAGKVLSKPLQGIAARTGLKCLASEKAELILGAAVADGLNAPEVGEDGKESTSRWYTRSLAGVAGLGIMTLGNASRMARTLGVVGRIGVGAIGANIQNAVTVGIDEHRRPTWEEVKEHGVSGAGMNSVMPVVHKWISKGAYERSQAERHNKELSKGRKVEEYGQYLGEMEAPRKSVWESIPKGPRETWEALKQGIGAFFIPKTIWGQSRTLREVVWESRLDKLGTRVRGSEKGSHADHVRDEVYIEKMKAGSEREKVEVIAKYGEECQHRILTKDPTIQIEFNKLRERMVQGENVEEGYIKLRVRMESEAREVGKKIREELQDKEGARAVTLDQEAILNERTPDGRTYKEHFAEEYQEFERTKNENEPTQLTRDYSASDNEEVDFNSRKIMSEVEQEVTQARTSIEQGFKALDDLYEVRENLIKAVQKRLSVASNNSIESQRMWRRAIEELTQRTKVIIKESQTNQPLRIKAVQQRELESTNRAGSASDRTKQAIVRAERNSNQIANLYPKISEIREIIEEINKIREGALETHTNTIFDQEGNSYTKFLDPERHLTCQMTPEGILKITDNKNHTVTVVSKEGQIDISQTNRIERTIIMNDKDDGMGYSILNGLGEGEGHFVSGRQDISGNGYHINDRKDGMRVSTLLGNDSSMPAQITELTGGDKYIYYFQQPEAERFNIHLYSDGSQEIFVDGRNYRKYLFHDAEGGQEARELADMISGSNSSDPNQGYTERDIYIDKNNGSLSLISPDKHIDLKSDGKIIVGFNNPLMVNGVPIKSIIISTHTRQCLIAINDMTLVIAEDGKISKIRP